MKHLDLIHAVTTGLQPSSAVIELNGNITVSCTFADGASSTGCRVTVFLMDGIKQVFSRNSTRPNGASQVGTCRAQTTIEQNNTDLLHT